MPIPTEPASYWQPDVNMSRVYSLRQDGSWHYNISGSDIAATDVPDDLTLLGRYVVA